MSHSRKLNLEASHIVNLQELLTEYDIENSFLNKQIKILLVENQQLKVNQLRKSILADKS